MMYTGTRGGVKIHTPRGKDHTYQFDEKLCAPICDIREGTGQFGVALGYLKWSDWVSSSTSSRLWAAGISPGSFEEWGINPDEYGLLDGPSDTVILPIHND